MSAVNGWRHQDRCRFYDALIADGWMTVRDARPVERLIRGGDEVRIEREYYRTARVIRGNSSCMVDGGGGRGWPERLARACVVAVSTMVAP